MFALEIIGCGVGIACVIVQIMLMKDIMDFKKKIKEKRKKKELCNKKEQKSEKIAKNNFSSPDDEEIIQKFIDEYFESINQVDEEGRNKNQ